MPSFISRSAAKSMSDAQPIIDQPGSHGMFMVGERTLFLCHMAMFTMEKHMYQVILRASLPAEIAGRYQQLRRDNPTKPYNLVNVDAEPFTLPQVKTGEVTRFTAQIFDGYSNDNDGTPGPVLFNGVEVTIDEIVHFRHFDFSFDYPAELTYILFGRDGEAHLCHYLSRDTDFDHILTLPAAPAWLPETQLRASAQLNFIGLKSTPTPCSSPLTEASYAVRFQGRSDTEQQLQVGTGTTIWFSTGNLLNRTDPCGT